MILKEELIKEIILYVGDREQTSPYFKAEDVVIPGYDQKEVYNHVAALIEGEIIDGFFAYEEQAPECGYLVGGLNTDTRYLYQQMKKAQR